MNKIVPTLLILFILPTVLFARSSANFEITSDNPTPVYFNTNSGSYTIEGTIEPIVGFPTGTNYQVDHGQWAWDEVSVPPAPTPGAAEGVPRSYFPTPLTIDPFSQCLFEKSNWLISGTKDQNTDRIYINDSMDGVEFTSPTTWKKEVDLNSGITTFIVYGRNNWGITEPLILTVFRSNAGDVNADRYVDDYDLSLLASHWQEDWCQADFNADGIVDDYDLSILASFWNYTY